MRPASVFVIVLAFSFGCCGREHQRRPEARDLCGTLLALLAEKSGGQLELDTLVMGPETRVSPEVGRPSEATWNRLRQDLPSLRRETLEDFWKQNDEPRRLTLHHAGAWKLQYVTAADEMAFKSWRKEFNGDVHKWWDRFRQRFPRGRRVFLSAPGFSVDRKDAQALIYYEYSFAPLAAGGACYLLERSRGKWRIAGEIAIWEA